MAAAIAAVAVAVHAVGRSSSLSAVVVVVADIVVVGIRSLLGDCDHIRSWVGKDAGQVQAGRPAGRVVESVAMAMLSMRWLILWISSCAAADSGEDCYMRAR